MVTYLTESVKRWASSTAGYGGYGDAGVPKAVPVSYPDSLYTELIQLPILFIQ